MTAEPTELVTFDATGAVVTLTLNRAAKRNALNDELVSAVDASMNWIDREQARLVVLRSSAPVFSAGADLTTVANRTPTEVILSPLARLCCRIRNHALPWVACLQGRTAGGGLELALSCDYRIATPDTILSLPEPTLGLIPSSGAIARLVELGAPDLASRLIIFGEELSAEEAVRRGVIQEMAPAHITESIISRLAETVCARDRRAVALTKMLLADHNSALPRDGLVQAALIGEGHHRPLVEAFLRGRYTERTDTATTGSV